MLTINKNILVSIALHILKWHWPFLISRFDQGVFQWMNKKSFLCCVLWLVRVVEISSLYLKEYSVSFFDGSLLSSIILGGPSISITLSTLVGWFSVGWSLTFSSCFSDFFLRSFQQHQPKYQAINRIKAIIIRIKIITEIAIAALIPDDNCEIPFDSIMTSMNCSLLCRISPNVSVCCA